MKKNTLTERRDDQLTPFIFGDHAVRTVLIDDAPWFIAKDVCDILEITRVSDALRDFPQNEKGAVSTRTLGGKQEMLTVNEPGLYRLIFQSRKPEAEKFKAWVFNEVLPAIRKTGGAYGMNEQPAPYATAGNVYSLFSACPDMTIQRVNKLTYYLAIRPPLSNADIAKLLGVSDATVTYWRKRLSSDAAREALGINALGHTESNNRRAGFPLGLPEKSGGAKGAGDEAE
jgi:prophage antirepressor-like protein